MPHFPRAAMWESEAMRRLGYTFSQVGGELGTLALKVQKVAIDDEVNIAKRDDLTALDAYELKMKDQVDPLKWGDEYPKEIDRLSTTRKFKTPAARKQYDAWAFDFRRRSETRMALAGTREAVRRFRGNIRSTMIAMVNAGEMDAFLQMLDDADPDAFAPDEKLKMKIEAVELEALNIFSASGVQAATDYVKTQNKVFLDANQKAGLIREINTAAGNQKKKTKLLDRAEERRKIAELYPKAINFELTAQDLKESVGKLSLDERSALERIYKGKSREQTDIKAYLDLEEKLFAHWRGLDKEEADKVSIRTQLALARCADGKLDSHAIAELTRRLDLEIGKNHIGALQDAFDSMRKTMTKGMTRWFGIPQVPTRWTLSDAEARAVAGARQATLDWLISETGRKKTPMPTEIEAQARHQTVVYRNLLVRMREPETQEEWEDTFKGISAKEERRAYYDKWVSKWR
jgi:hypothetical protein